MGLAERRGVVRRARSNCGARAAMPGKDSFVGASSKVTESKDAVNGQLSTISRHARAATRYENVKKKEEEQAHRASF